MYSDKILSLKNLKRHWTIWGEFFHTDNPSRILKPAVLKMFEFTTQTNNLKINMLLLANLVVQVCFKATPLFTCKHLFFKNHWQCCVIFLKSWLSLFLRCVYISTLIKSVYFSASYQGVLHSLSVCLFYKKL